MISYVHVSFPRLSSRSETVKNLGVMGGSGVSVFTIEHKIIIQRRNTEQICGTQSFVDLEWLKIVKIWFYLELYLGFGLCGLM